MSTQFAPIWNNASVDFTCIKANVTDSNSGSNSTLLDLLVGGTSKFKVDKSGAVFTNRIQFGSNINDAVIKLENAVMRFGYFSNGENRFYLSGGAMAFASNYEVSWTNGNATIGTTDVRLFRDAANTLALRNDASAQALRIYNTYTDANNYERAKIAWESNVLRIGTEGLGTGAVTPRSMEFQTAGTTRLTIGATNGNVTVNLPVNETWFSLQYAASEFVKLGLVNAGYGIGGGSVYTTPGSITFGSGAASVRATNVDVGTSSASFTIFNHQNNTTPHLTIKTVGYTTKPSFAIESTAGQTADSIQVFSDGGITKTFSVTPSGVATIGTVVIGRQTSLSGGASVDEVRATPGNALSVRFGSNTWAANRITGDAAGYQIAFATRYTSDTSYVAMISNGLSLGSATPFGWSSTTSAGEASYDVSLFRDAANTLALRRVNTAGTTTYPQAFRIYNNVDGTDAAPGSNYERAKIAWESNVLVIGTEAGGSGAKRKIRLSPASVDASSYIDFDCELYGSRISAQYGLSLRGNNDTRKSVAFCYVTNTGFPIIGNEGYSFASRCTANKTIGFDPYHSYHDYEVGTIPNLTLRGHDCYATAVTNISGGHLYLLPGAGASGSAGVANGGHVYLDGGQGYGTGVHGSIIIGATRARLLAFGGTTSSFPAIKRNSAALNFRLADDSADCDITAAKATLSATLDLTIRTVTYGATMAIDAALGNKIAITLAGNGTISNPTNAVDGRVLVFRLRQDATGSRIPVWDTKYSFVGDLATVTLSTAANAIDRIAFEYDSTTDKWYCISFIKGS